MISEIINVAFYLMGIFLIAGMTKRLMAEDCDTRDLKLYERLLFGAFWPVFACLAIVAISKKVDPYKKSSQIYKRFEDGWNFRDDHDDLNLAWRRYVVLEKEKKSAYNNGDL